MRVVVCLLIFLTFISVVHAQENEEMSSPLYKLQIKELDASTEAALKNKENSLLLKDRMKFATRGFVVQAHEPDRPFSFEISNTVVTFDNLAKNHDSQSSTTLSVDTNGGTGYQILALASPLVSSSGQAIDLTECNGGKDTCTPRIARIWTDDDRYGWGYQVLGPDAINDFADKKYFRPVDLENWMLFSDKGGVLTDRKTQLNFKINVPSNIAEVQYVSLIKILAVPK